MQEDHIISICRYCSTVEVNICRCRWLTSGLVNMHEDHIVIRCQDGVELLVTHRWQLSRVPSVPLVHRDKDVPQGALKQETKKKKKKKKIGNKN